MLLTSSFHVHNLDSSDLIEAPSLDETSGIMLMPDGAVEEINARLDEVDALRNDDAGCQQEEPPRFRPCLEIHGLKLLAYVECPGGRKVRAGTFTNEERAWQAAEKLANRLAAAAA